VDRLTTPAGGMLPHEGDLAESSRRRSTERTHLPLTALQPGAVRCLWHRVAIRDTVSAVIVSFRHKGLERLYRDGSNKGVQAAQVPKLLRILSVLDVAQAPEDLAIPSFRTHPLKGEMAGHWSIWVNGNWRVTFRFLENDVELVDYQDYH